METLGVEVRARTKKSEEIKVDIPRLIANLI